MAATPVLLVGQNPGIARALGNIVSDGRFEVVAQFEDHLAACGMSSRLSEPELILLIEASSDAPQTEAIGLLRLCFPEAQIVVLGDAAKKVALSTYVEAGASGRLSLAMTRSAMLRALRAILCGGRLFVSGEGRNIVPEEEWDRRQSLRRQTYMACELDPGKGRPHVPGRIFEMSHAGAKFRVDVNIRVPAAFDLRFKEGLVRRCKVVRRSAGCFCVAFADGLGGRSTAMRPETHMGI